MNYLKFIIILSDDVDLHVFLDRNIWQASIMLINDDIKSKDHDFLKNWDQIDDWYGQESTQKHFEEINHHDKSNTLTTYKMDESQFSSFTNLSKLSNKLSKNGDVACQYACPQMTEKSDVESLNDMKESFVPVLVGSTNGSNDFMV